MNLLASIMLFAVAVPGDAPEVKMLLFTSDNCPACQTVKPGVDMLLDKGYPIEKINISDSPAWADRYQITKVPTFVLLRDGKELGRKSGAMSPHDIAQHINEATPVRREPKTETRETADGDGYSTPIYPVEQPLGTPVEQPVIGQQIEQPIYNTTPIEVLPVHPVEITQPDRVSRPIDVVPGITAGADGNSLERVVPERLSPQPNRDTPAKRISSGSSENKKKQLQRTDPYEKPSNEEAAAEINGDLSKEQERALRATVRFRIVDDEGTNHGSGTIIHVHGNEALVITCGHIFRESKGTGRVFADVGFPDNQRTVRGKLLDYDAGDRDIALCVIQLDIPIEPVPIAHREMQPYSGNPLFSFGCDRGGDPTIRNGKMLRVSTYSGVKKYDVSNRPIDGRSGGGLYSSQGELIGVCNAADVNADEGIYVGLGTVHSQIASVGLTEVLRMPSTSPDAELNSMASIADARSTYGATAGSANAPQNGQPRRSPTIADIRNDSTTVSDLVPVTRAIENAGSDVEMLIIVRSKSNPAQTNSFLLDQPGPELIRMVAAERLREKNEQSPSGVAKPRVARLEEQDLRR